MDSLSSLGMYSLYFSKASAPAAKLSHSNLTPVASIEHAHRSLNDFGADAVAGDEGYFVCHKL